MRIKFKRVAWKNFLSTGNAWIEIQLDKAPTTLMVGANGSGKSILLDALCFGLFGKSFRKANKPTLVNSINNKDLLVEVDFTLGQREYMIRRGMKPNVFEIYQDGVLINQSAGARDYQEYIETHVLKINEKSFTQTDALGLASYTPFMLLPAASRRDFIEDLLGIKVFSVMSSIVKDDADATKQELKDVGSQLAILKEKLDLKEEHVKTLQKDKNDTIKELNDTIRELHSKRNGIIVDIQTYKERLRKTKAKLLDETKLRERSKKLARIENSLETKLTTARKHVDLYQTRDQCPTCEQSISDDFKKEKIAVAKADIKVLDSSLQETRKVVDEQDALFEKQNARILEISNLEKEVTNKEAEVKVIDAQLKDNISKRDGIVQTDGGSISFEKDALKELAEESKELLLHKKELTEKRDLIKVAGELLKDKGIKTSIIRHYMPVINSLINKYLAAMDYFVQFEIDENFNEHIKSRYRDEFSYYNFSQGQKMRIDLSLLLAWRAVAKLKNSINTNILILDEVFDASLDPDGCDAFLKLIYELSSDTHVFVISHRGDMLGDKFSRTLKFNLSKNFTTMAET